MAEQVNVAAGHPEHEPDEQLVEFYARDHPEADGRTAEPGDVAWTLCLPLAGRMRLHLHICRESYDRFAAMLAAEATDDALEQLEDSDA